MEKGVDSTHAPLMEMAEFLVSISFNKKTGPWLPPRLHGIGQPEQPYTKGSLMVPLYPQTCIAQPF